MKKKVRTGDRAGAVALARRWTGFFPRSGLLAYSEYWALNGDRDYPPGEHIDLLRRVHSLSRRPVSTFSVHLTHELIRMYAKWEREEYAAEAIRLVDATRGFCGESFWTLSILAELAHLRGDYYEERSLRARGWEIHPKPDHPTALMEKAVQLHDDGDRDTAEELLRRASSNEKAPALVHVYLSVLVEVDDPATAALARERAVKVWRESPGGLERKFEFVRRRLHDGPFADLRPRPWRR